MAKQFPPSQRLYMKLLGIPETEYQKIYDGYLRLRRSDRETPVFKQYLKRWYQSKIQEEWYRLRLANLCERDD